MKKITYIIFFTVLTPVLFIACSSPKKEALTTVDQKAGEWVKPANQGGNSAAYFMYVNKTAETDTLISVKSPKAGMAEVHESYEEDGMKGMKRRTMLTILPGDTLRFQQGQIHLMLMQLTEDLQKGDSLMIELEFARAGTKTFKLPVTSEK